MKQIQQIIVALVVATIVLMITSAPGETHPTDTINTNTARFDGRGGPAHGTVTMTQIGGICKVKMVFTTGFHDPDINHYSFIIDGDDYSSLFRQHVRILDPGTVPVTFFTDEPICNFVSGAIAGKECIIYHVHTMLGVALFIAEKSRSASSNVDVNQGR